jgi:hypothetical protein
MKKTLTLGVVLLSALAFSACEKKSNDSKTSNNSSFVADKPRSRDASTTSKSSESTLRSFTKKAPITESSAKKNEILSGNYSSLNGTWTNSHGYKLVFNNGRVVAPINNSNKTYSLIKPTEFSNIVGLTLYPAPAPNGMTLMIAFKNTEAKTSTNSDGTDISKDRIIMGNNGGADLFMDQDDGGISDTAYYRNN